METALVCGCSYFAGKYSLGTEVNEEETFDCDTFKVTEL